MYAAFCARLDGCRNFYTRFPAKAINEKLKPLTYIKYAVLLFAVVLLPVLVVNDVGMGDPFFCKYICPQGVLEVRFRCPS